MDKRIILNDQQQKTLSVLFDMTLDLSTDQEWKDNVIVIQNLISDGTDVPDREQVMRDITNDEENDIVEWYSGTFCTIEDIPTDEIQFWKEEMRGDEE